MHHHGLRRQRIGIGAAVVARLDARRQHVGFRVDQRVPAEVGQIECAVLQRLGDRVGHAEAGVAGAGVGPRRTTDQAHDQRRRDHFDAGDISHGKAVLGTQRHHAFDAAMSGTPSGIGLVTELGHTTGVGEAVEHRSEVMSSLEQRQIAERPLEHGLRRGKA